MREARMTFGEHLEELRRRLIFSLLYLAVGVSICMVYGKDLMEVALGPHYRAIRNAQRDRLVARMQKTATRLRELTAPAPANAAPAGEKPLVEGPIYWEAVFARDVALDPLRKRIEQVFDESIAQLGGSESERRLAETLRGLGSSLSRVLVEEFASEFAVEELSTIPRRFAELETLLKTAEATAGPGEVQKAIGWGADIRLVTEPIHEFVEFLKLRREEVLKSPIAIPILRQRVRETQLPRALNELLVGLEKSAREIVEGKAKAPMVISYMESFASYLKVSLIFGILLTLPFILYEAWKFVGAGLYPHEQKYVITLLPMSLVLFAAGSVFGYFALIPIGLEFLAGWGIEDVDINITLGSYIGLFFTLTLILGMIFQTPLVMIFLAQIGIMDVKSYRRMRRAAIFIGVCLAVVLTPPDPFSWSLMAAPMILLYEVGIWCCGLLEKRKSRAPAGRPEEASTG